MHPFLLNKKMNHNVLIITHYAMVKQNTTATLQSHTAEHKCHANTCCYVFLCTARPAQHATTRTACHDPRSMPWPAQYASAGTACHGRHSMPLPAQHATRPTASMPLAGQLATGKHPVCDEIEKQLCLTLFLNGAEYLSLLMYVWKFKIN